MSKNTASEIAVVSTQLHPEKEHSTPSSTTKNSPDSPKILSVSDAVLESENAHVDGADLDGYWGGEPLYIEGEDTSSFIGESTAKSKTDALVRTTLPVELLIPNDQNPNEMSDQEFNLLYDNIERMGVTDPILVRPHPEQEGMYKIVGGHHRCEVAKLHGIEEVPVTIIMDEEFDDDAEKFQMVRHNIIHGKMNPKKFMALYQTLQGKYAEDVAAEMFGFASEDDFKKMVQLTAKALPPEMKQTFIDASKEIKTIDDLAGVLNKLFTTYGDTVPYGYMIFDFGGNDHVWCRLKKGQKERFRKFANMMRDCNRSIDAGIDALLQMASSNLDEDSPAFEQMMDLVMAHPEVTIAGSDADALLTEDYLASMNNMAL